MKGFLKRKKTLLILLIILTVAAFFRLWQLDKIPPGLYPDVAINGNDALNTLNTRNFQVFYPENNGREGLFIWLIAASFSVFGVSVWSIKIVAAIIGILTVLGLYLLTKELFLQCNEERPRYIALLSSFFLAVSFWHTNFSRIGFRAILLSFILVFAFYFLFKGFRQTLLRQGYGGQRKIWHFIIAGIFFGLGFYTYISYRFVILLLPLILFFWWKIYQKEKQVKKFLLFTVSCFLFTVIVALPIGIYFLQHPQDFIGRAAPISVFSAENPVKEFGKSLILYLGMFNFYGDSNWRHNFSGSPMLFWPIGILFLIGLIFSIKEIIKNKDLSLVIGHWSLVIWFLIMLLPGILTYEGIPHALRTVGVIPVVYIFAGLGGWYAYKWFGRVIKNKKLFLTLCLFFLISITYGQFCKYFLNWARNPEVENAFSKDYLEMGNYLNSLSPEIQKYVIVNQPGVPVPYPDGLPMPAQTPMFIESAKYEKPRSIYLLPENLDQIKIEGDTVILPMVHDEKLFEKLKIKFPQGEVREENRIKLFIVQLTD